MGAEGPRALVRALLLGLLSAGWSATFLAAQAEPQVDDGKTEGKAAPTFFEAIDVDLVNVDVVVTDRQGRLVRGLTAADFEVWEDGRPVEITHFDAVFGPDGSAALEETVLDTPALAGAAAATADVLALPPLQLVLFVDNLHISPTDRQRIFRPVRDFVESSLGDDDRVMILSFDGDLRIRQQLSSSVPATLDALEEVMRSSSQGQGVATERRALEREVRDLLEESSGPALIAAVEEEGDLLEGFGPVGSSGVEAAVRVAFYRVRDFAASRQRDARASLAALREAVALLSAIPGRKALLYVGGGLSTRPGAKLYEEWLNAATRAGVPPRDVSLGSTFSLDVNGELRRLTELANAHRVTVYAAGVVAEDSLAGMAAENRGGLLGGVRAGSESSAGLVRREAPNFTNALAMMAGPTGGFASTADFGRLFDRVRTDFSRYYSLAYEPDRRRDTELHQVRVEVRRPGLQLRYREQFREKSAAERMVDRTKSALLLAHPENPLQAVLDVADAGSAASSAINDPAEAATGGEDGDFQRLRVTVKIPMAKLALLPQESFHEGQLSLFVSVRDRRGRVSEMGRREVPIRIPNDRLLATLGQLGAFPLHLRLRPGRHTIAVGVRDELGHVESIVRIVHPPVTASDAQATGR